MEKGPWYGEYLKWDWLLGKQEKAVPVEVPDVPEVTDTELLACLREGRLPCPDVLWQRVFKVMMQEIDKNK